MSTTVTDYPTTLNISEAAEDAAAKELDEAIAEKHKSTAVKSDTAAEIKETKSAKKVHGSRSVGRPKNSGKHEIDKRIFNGRSGTNDEKKKPLPILGRPRKNSNLDLQKKEIKGLMSKPEHAEKSEVKIAERQVSNV